MTVRQIELPRHPQAPQLARRHVDARFRHRLTAAAAENVAIVVSELVTNALVHGRGRIVLETELRGDRLHIEVIDEGTGNAPNVREQPHDSVGGWGLRIVDHIALRWGAFEGTTHVWADLPLD